MDPDYGGCACLDVAGQSIKYIPPTFGKETCLCMKERRDPNTKTDYLNCEVVEKQGFRVIMARQNKAKASDYSLTV